MPLMPERALPLLAAVALLSAWPGLAAAQVPAGAEFQVNTYTTGAQAGPGVASDAQGNFVVAWQDTRGTGTGIFGRRFDAAGLPRGGEFQASAALSPMYFGVRAASSPAGHFIVTWLF